MYKKTLASFWYRTHKLAGNIIDQELAWSEPEAKEFGELAYEVAFNRGWLKYLDNLNEGQLILLIIAVETDKVKRVLEKQNAQPRQPREKPSLITGRNQQQHAPHQATPGPGPAQSNGSALAQYTEPVNLTNLRANPDITGSGDTF